MTPPSSAAPLVVARAVPTVGAVSTVATIAAAPVVGNAGSSSSSSSSAPPAPAVDDIVGAAAAAAAAGGGRGIVFEFQGCYVHGCPRCFKTQRDVKMSFDRTMHEAYENTRAKIDRIRALGYEVREMWECDFREARLADPTIDDYLKDHPLASKITLDPRDAFYGGRTENLVTRYVTSPTERIKYTDICSLYPYVCKRGKFPLRHPRIYVGEQCNELTGGRNDDLSRIEGLVKCRVLAPRDLFLPVLPVKMNDHLLFPLCRSCCEMSREREVMVGECAHEDDGEREFSGTWVADELRKAVELGYRVVELQIVWQYETTRYDQRTGRGGLFADYVNLFLKIKQEASGWPSNCCAGSSSSGGGGGDGNSNDNVDDAKARYLREYESAEGIRLDPARIQRNEGLRQVAKLCLNSFWGKFAQRSNLRQTSIVKSREELLSLVLCPEKEVYDLIPVTDDILYATWQLRDEAVITTPHTNVVIAAYVTAQARLKLYEHLELLGRRALYYDTDSCIFVCNYNNINNNNNNDHDDDEDNVPQQQQQQQQQQGPREYEPPIGTLLGSMTDVLATDYGQGSYITSFLSGGPKFYAFRALVPATNTIKECCKVKGITMNYASSSRINFASIENLLTRYFREIVAPLAALNDDDAANDAANDDDAANDNNNNNNVNDNNNNRGYLRPIELNFRSIRRTREHEVVTRDETKSCFVVLKKRRFVAQSLSYPFGYKSPPAAAPPPPPPPPPRC